MPQTPPRQLTIIPRSIVGYPHQRLYAFGVSFSLNPSGHRNPNFWLHSWSEIIPNVMKQFFFKINCVQNCS